VKHFASLLGAQGIRVNAVAPGVVETDMSNFTKTDAGRDLALGMQALKRLAQPDDIGGVVAFPRPKMRAGSPAIPSMWTAVQSSELWLASPRG
jgi:NAD(P)-dependent dehydrogenase (short-subunit alcohol dehydrogenase family)